MEAPSFDVGTDLVNKGTVSYSNSIGSADSFSVGASTNIGATATASSTPDYNVTSKATFGINKSTINQVIGTSIGTGTTIPSNPIKVLSPRPTRLTASTTMSRLVALVPMLPSLLTATLTSRQTSKRAKSKSVANSSTLALVLLTVLQVVLLVPQQQRVRTAHNS